MRPRFSRQMSECVPRGMLSLGGGTWRVGLLPLEPAHEDIRTRKAQTEGERQDRDEHNGEMQRDYSPHVPKASETEAESGKEIQPKGKTCPFSPDLKEEDGLKRTQKSGEDTHEHENNETQGKRDEESDCSSPGSRRTSERLPAESSDAGWPANRLSVGEQWGGLRGCRGRAMLKFRWRALYSEA